MLKMLQKILVILLVSIIFISTSSNIIQAAYTLTEATIVEIGEIDYHLQYYQEDKGMYTYSTCSIVGYYDDATFYPAYCLNRDLHGVGAVESYAVDIDDLIENDAVWRAVKNGYPYKTAEEMGLSSSYNAFAVTKFAIYCIIGQADVNLYKADEGDTEGQAMLSALQNLVNIGLNGTDTFSDELEIVQTGDFREEGNYYCLTYKVNAGSTISSYTISSISGLSEGDIVTDINGNIKSTFSSGENFKVKILKSNLTEDKNINIEVEANLKSYPLFYGKTRISGTQNYLLTGDSYENVSSNVSTKLKLDTGKIILTKIDSENGNVIPETVFEVYNSNNELIGTYTTDETGKITVSNLYQGRYTIKEVQANENYILDETEQTIDVKYNETTTLSLENEHKKGNLTIYKIDKDNNNITLGNIGLELYSNETEELLGTYYTDANGKIEIDNLRIGSYRIKEINTNEWYNLAEDTNIEVKWEETTETYVQDELKKGKVQVIKVDKDNNEIKIEGAIFEVQDINGNVLETITTNEQGLATTKEYSIRDYSKLILHEIQTNENYSLTNEIIEVNLIANETKTITVENEVKKGKVKVIKVDEDNNEIKLAGVEFNLLDEEKNVVDTLVTDENGEATSKMLPISQSYTLQEVSTLENYSLDLTEITVNLTENETTEFTITNEKKKGQIKIIKVDKDNNEIKLQGVEFNVLNEAGDVIETITTDEKGEALTSRLAIDEKYILQETLTNEKYVLSQETKTVTLEQDKITEITFENEKIKGYIEIIKTTEDKSEVTGLEAGMPLEGVVFEVYDINQNLLQKITTNKDGIAKTTELEKGMYIVKEVSTNEYYILDETEHFAEIVTNNQVVTLNIKNKSGVPDLEVEKTGPSTATCDEEIEYSISVQNTGNVALDNFMWEDEIPTDYIRITKMTIGTYNQENTYNLYYKTNLSDDYILLLEDLSTIIAEDVDFSSELSEGEYITSIKLDFGTVDVGFKTETETKLLATINSDVKHDDVFVNKVMLTGKYNGYNIEKPSVAETIIYKILPLTGM